MTEMKDTLFMQASHGPSSHDAHDKPNRPTFPLGPTGPCIYYHDDPTRHPCADIVGGPNLQRWSMVVVEHDGVFIGCPPSEAREAGGWTTLYATPLGWSNFPPDGWTAPEWVEEREENLYEIQAEELT